MWEFSALGLSILELPIILEGHHEGEKLQVIRLKPVNNGETRRGRPTVARRVSKLTALKKKLSVKSDDETDMEVSKPCDNNFQHTFDSTY